MHLHKNEKLILSLGKQNFTIKVFIAFKMAYKCCFRLGENLDFPDFLQKSFITSTTGLYVQIRLVKVERARGTRMSSHAVSTV